jgi:uncharacterized protein YjiS (DUF1127 family)
MFGLQNSAGTRLPAAGVWVRRGEGLARAAAAAVRAAGRWMQRAYSAMAGANARRDAKRALYALDDRMLQDIGLRRDEVASTVDAMFRRAETKVGVEPVRDLNASETNEVAVTDASNDRRFESAA